MQDATIMHQGLHEMYPWVLFNFQQELESVIFFNKYSKMKFHESWFYERDEANGCISTTFITKLPRCALLNKIA